jgi:starch synthase
MDILFATSELAPFVKVGGLADVAAALPKALRALGHKVTIVLPRYAALDSAGLMFARRLSPLKFSLGDRSVEATLYDGRLSAQVDLILVDIPGLYDRAGVYGERGEDYADNALRFASFSRAVAEIAKTAAEQGAPYAVVHANDWPTALVTTFVRMLRADAPSLDATRTLLSLHNVAHQGIFPKEMLPTLGLGWGAFNPEGIEFYGKCNVLKQGILSADALTTVSPTYARELQTEASGHGLHGVLAARKGVLTGIANGVDYSVWNPAVDPAIAARFDAEDAANKHRCKGALQRELGLPLEPHEPLIVSVGRLVHQKGTDLVAEILPALMRGSSAQVAIAGDGDEALATALTSAVETCHGRAVFVRAAEESVVHRMFAAADLVLVPSRYEPCGLVQMYAQRYGAPPVVRATGGLIDSVVDCDSALETGTGFTFAEDSAEALLGATLRGVSATRSPAWSKLVRRVMKLDRSWDGPARRYEQVLKSLIAR